ncbi:sugar MFS transporter [Phocaeicola barnesiae]|uniref:sugar MFS transporter n=1 Tax=Phocaeicola barnesiae TaxID=376804 RepID=UPI001E1011B0|nr:sugar MFS transporter [Phocaeicola barnesiae]HJG78770.1 sugar MFS transporter [Phocaeicola barnesiae]
MKKKPSLVRLTDGTSLLVPFILITSLFFLWGFAHSILDVLNKHFQDALGITKTKSALVQAVVYGGYFLMALPAGAIIKRWGYRTGVLTGLLLYGVGALLFIPGGSLQSFEFFLFSLFVIGCGLTCLETAANPYVTVLGEPAAAERRINLAQAFNGLGWICGPLVGGFFLFAENSESNISLPYAIIGVVVLLVALVFSRIRLPEINPQATSSPAKETTPQSPRIELWKQRSFTFGLVTLFLYVAAQTGINSFFINYATEQAGISAHEASIWLSFGGMGLFMLGRMGGSWLMGYLQPEKLLALCASGATLAMLAVIFLSGKMGLSGFFLCFLCESIMFPTIFALAIRGLDEQTKRASSYLIMSIVGGAVAPILMGYIADTTSMALGFIVPLVCFVEIGCFAMGYKRVKS